MFYARSRPVLVLLTALGTLTLSAKEQPVNSKINAAKVFLTGAQVTRTASASISAGSTTLIFTGLSQEVDQQSIQVNGKGGFAIFSVNHRINYLTESPKKKEVEDLQAQIKKLEKEWAFEKAMQDVWVNEEQLLGKNSAIGGQQNGLTAAQLTAVNDYVRQRLVTTKTNWLAQQEKLTRIGEEADKLRAQLAQFQGQQPRPTSEIVVEIDAPADVAATFTLTYFVRSAGWAPAYDLRAKSTGQPIELLMKAQVINNTGEDWERVELALSSGNPTQAGVMPQLSAWVLEQPIYLQTISGTNRRPVREMSRAAAPPVQMDASGYTTTREEIAATTEMANTVVYRTTTVEFAIEAAFSVPSDGMAHTVGVKTHSVPALYIHYCTPKLEKDAFLYARTTGWEDLNLLPGQANVFFEGTYVGQSFLDLGRPQDTLNISLGRDKGVVVERVKRKGFSDKPVIGGKRTVTIGWDLNVRNNKNAAVELEIRDQYPVSSRSEVEVKLTENGGAKVDEPKGQLTWTLKLEPKAIQKLGFTYTVKHPKDQPVVLE